MARTSPSDAKRACSWLSSPSPCSPPHVRRRRPARQRSDRGRSRRHGSAAEFAVRRCITAGLGGVTVPPSASSPGASSVGRAVAGEPAAAAGTIGDPGIGDPYYPTEGNGGYQVDSYDLTLSYDPPTATTCSRPHLINGIGAVRRRTDPVQPRPAARPDGQRGDRQRRPRDLQPAGRRTGHHPRAPCRRSRRSGVSGDLRRSTRPGAGGTAGSATAAGTARIPAAPSPPASRSARPPGIPVNEHPADTATFAVTATVPDEMAGDLQRCPADRRPARSRRRQGGVPVEAQRAGRQLPDHDLHRHVRHGRTTPWPTASRSSPRSRRTRRTDAKTWPCRPRAFSRCCRELLRAVSVRGRRRHLHRYPDRLRAGDRDPPDLQRAERDDLDTVVHELAHQWYGDDVTVERWSDICLNECFASYAPWLYTPKVNGADLDAIWKRQMAQVVDDRELLDVPAGRHGSGQRVHQRLRPRPAGPARAADGDRRRRFLRAAEGLAGHLRRQERHLGRVRGLRDAGRRPGHDPFMDAWFRGTTVPAEEFRYPGNLGN